MCCSISVNNLTDLFIYSNSIANSQKIIAEACTQKAHAQSTFLALLRLWRALHYLYNIKTNTTEIASEFVLNLPQSYVDNFMITKMFEWTVEN